MSYQALSGGLYSHSKRHGLIPLNYKISFQTVALIHHIREPFATSIFHSTQPFPSQINLPLPPWPSLSLWFPHTVPRVILVYFLVPKQARASSSYHHHNDAHFLQKPRSVKQTLLEKFTTGAPFPLKELRMTNFENTSQKNKNICCLLTIRAMKQRFSLR